MQIAIRFLIASLVATLLFYLAAWPVPVSPVAWQTDISPGYTGVHASNTRLTALRRIELGGHEGPEHVAVAPDGLLYAAVAGGRVLRMALNGTGLVVFAKTGGRVLGFDFDSAGRIIAADAVRGLLSIDGEGSVRVLVDEINGQPLLYADAVAVAPDGKIYFTDASQRFSPREWGGTFEACVLDLLENSATGRVLMFDPSTGAVELVAAGLSFPNGIVMTHDGEDLLVAETGRYRIWRIAAHARNLDLQRGANSNQPHARLILDNLPGFPDNLMRGLEGRIWLGLVKPRTAALDALASYPSLRKVAARLPRFLQPVPKPYGHVIAFNEKGDVVADLQDPSGIYPESTSVTETGERLYVQSLYAHWLGWLPRTALSTSDAAHSECNRGD
jgi:sugar lactone lactonase YvrE